MDISNETPKRKYLKTIYAIQQSFGSQFGNISRNFSFGIKPTQLQEENLELWFSQVNEVKNSLYQEVYKNFKAKPNAYLGNTFEYETFFKGRSLLAEIKRNKNLITSVPIIEGLRMEITGSIRSFITNHKRKFEENLGLLLRFKKLLNENKEQLKGFIDTEGVLEENLEKLMQFSYEEVVLSYESLQDFENLLFAFNESVAEYNYGVNQINTSQKLHLYLMEKLSRLPAFPGVTEKELYKLDDLLEQLTRLSSKEVESSAVVSFLQRAGKRIERVSVGKRKRFEDRLAAYLYKKYDSDFRKQEVVVREFSEALNEKITKLKAHFAQKPYDGTGRNKYFEALAFKARLVHPETSTEINTVLSKAKSFFFQGRTKREIITIPGFSWDKAQKGKPLKHCAFAFENKTLYICISSSSRAFHINEENNRFIFVKTTGGQKKRNSEPKSIGYVRGNFQEIIENDTPLLLPLHFGKSYARRYLFNKQWGLFSKNPKIFLNNARIKREKTNPGDHWKYYFDVSLSGERVFGYKDFALDILSKAECVIGVDRGEVQPIAFTVLRIRDNAILTKGFLASAYIEQLKKYDTQKRDYQSKGRIIPKFLKSKVTRLQETLLKTASSEILSLVGKYKGIVVLENLNERFKGAERSLIPKKTYKKVEKLLSDSLQLAGLVRVDTNGSFWGALKTVYPAGTSQTCLKCGQVWKKDFKQEILAYTKSNNYQNIDYAKKILKFDDIPISLHDSFSVYNREKKHNELKRLADLERLNNKNSESEKVRLLLRAIEPRVAQDRFICGLCGFRENADIVGATNIGRRGIGLIQKTIQK